MALFHRRRRPRIPPRAWSTPRELRAFLRSHADPRFVCYCLDCLYGRRLLESAPRPALSRALEAFRRALAFTAATENP